MSGVLESGAHFDTLDFPWGHVRLSTGDIDRYLARHRAAEVGIARKRLYGTLNRMTLRELRQTVTRCGFRIIEWFETYDDPRRVTPSILIEARANYPSISLADLLASDVVVLLEKPDDPRLIARVPGSKAPS